MAISVHDYEGSVTLTNPAGGTTANTLFFSSSNHQVVLPIATITSVGSVTCYGPSDRKRLSGVKKKTGAAWTVNQPLTYSTSFGFFNATKTAWIYAMALTASLTGDLTGDVLLVPPTGQGA